MLVDLPTWQRIGSQAGLYAADSCMKPSFLERRRHLLRHHETRAGALVDERQIQTQSRTPSLTGTWGLLDTP
jgi:hypothetical protein